MGEGPPLKAGGDLGPVFTAGGGTGLELVLEAKVLNGAWDDGGVGGGGGWDLDGAGGGRSCVLDGVGDGFEKEEVLEEMVAEVCFLRVAGGGGGGGVLTEFCFFIVGGAFFVGGALPAV